MQYMCDVAHYATR